MKAGLVYHIHLLLFLKKILKTPGAVKLLLHSNKAVQGILTKTS